MKLFLMRHAATEPSYTKLDIERSLTEKGISEAQEAATFLKEEQIDRVLVSIATRTIQTYDNVSQYFQQHSKELVKEIYHGSMEDILEILCNQTASNVMIIGHNPAIFQLALHLIDSQCSEYQYLIDTSMPTCRIIILDFPEFKSWNELSAKGNVGNIVKIFTPTILN